MAYNPDVSQDSFQIYSVILRTRPHRLYLTAERAFNKDDTHSVLYWEAGLERIATHSPAYPTYLSDPRGEIVQIGRRDIVTGENFKGWLRIDELNVPLNVVPLKYYTPHTRDIGKLWRVIAEEQGISAIHVGLSAKKLLGLWNDPNSNSIGHSVGEHQVGKTFIVDMGFPPTGDANLFRNEYLENNRYQNASQSQMVSVKLQGRPNTRYVAKTSAPRNSTSDNHEVFIGLYPSEPNQNIGFSVNGDIIFVTDHKGEIELSFYDSELSGVDTDYLDFLDYTYWVEILVHPNQSMTVPPDMILQSESMNYGLYNGDNLDSGLELKPGINEITITGKGKISFHWNNEVMS